MLFWVRREYVEADDGSFVVVGVAVVGGGEYGDDQREVVALVPLVHLVPVELRLVRPDNRQQLVVVQKLGGCLHPVEEGAPAHVVELVSFREFALFIFDRI